MTADELEDDRDTDSDEHNPPPGRARIADRKLYEVAMVAYTEFPGQHAKVAAIVETQTAHKVSGTLMRLWYTRGLKSLSLPPIAEALKTQVRAALGGQPGYGPDGQPVKDTPGAAEGPHTATLNDVPASTRRKLRRLAATAETRVEETRAAAELDRERLALERDKVKLELVRAEADKARAQAEAEKQKASAAVAAGRVDGSTIDLVKRRAEDAKIMTGLKAQMLFTIGVFNRVLQGVAHLAPKVEQALQEEAATVDADKGLKLVRRAVSTFKDLAETVERGMKLDRLILGEPTEIHQINGPTSDDPIHTIMAAVEALHRSAERGGVELSAEQRALIEAVDTTAVEVDSDGDSDGDE